MAKKRVTIFAKGNLDVRDSLYGLSLGGERRWNGLNEVLREHSAGIVVRIRHETWTRSDALLAAQGAVPTKLLDHVSNSGPFGLVSQFSTALFDMDFDAAVLSVQPDVHISLARLTEGGEVFHPYGVEAWSTEQRGWLRSACEPVAKLDVAQSMHNFNLIIERIRAKRDVPILIYNLSAVVPGERIYAYDGLDEPLSTRIRKFNLGLIELSAQTGAAVVDVDSIVAKAGADHVQMDPTHLNAQGCRLVAMEVSRMLQAFGVLELQEPGP